MSYSASIIGAGSYGTALAVSLTRNGRDVLLWGRDPQEISVMEKERCNSHFLPGITFPSTLHLTSNLEEAANNSDILLIAVPSNAFSSVLKTLKPYIKPTHKIVWATKGLESGTGRLLSDVAQEILGTKIPLAVISGPTFAKELANGLPTAIAVAGNNDSFTDEFSKLIHSSKNFRVYKNPDLVGVQIGGTVKNVIAIGAGIADGLGFGANARTALITRGLVEIQRLGVKMGANPHTFMGMAGLGDLILTCTDNQSRNRRFGIALGQGKSPDEAIKEIGQVVEGWHNTKEVHTISQNLGIDMPICEEIYKVLFKNKSPQDATATLLARKMIEE